MSKISRKNHNLSLDKWGGEIIKSKLRNKVPFDDENGWHDLSIFDKCGYCKETVGDCAECPLFDKNYKYSWSCGKYFNGFINAIDQEKPNFTKAEWHRVRLYNQILSDEPNVYEGE